MTVTDALAACPRMAESAVITQDASATTVLDPVSGRIFVINDVGRRILELSDGAHTLDSIGESIAAEFHGAESEALQRDIEDFLRGCTEASIVRWENSPNA